jgi:ketosteroid isomerase-like protein
MGCNVALAKRFLDILSGENLSPLRELFCEDVRFEYPGLGAITGRSKTVLLLKKIMSRFEALRFQAVDFVQDGEKLCVLWTNEGRLKAGEAFRNEGVTILHIRNGTISYVSDYFKHDRAA